MYELTRANTFLVRELCPINRMKDGLLQFNGKNHSISHPKNRGLTS